jgi:hypothetical protein
VEALAFSLFASTCPVPGVRLVYLRCGCAACSTTDAMNATIDLDESLRALYFAPFPMLVLDQNRKVRVVNASAEKVR